MFKFVGFTRPGFVKSHNLPRQRTKRKLAGTRASRPGSSVQVWREAIIIIWHTETRGQPAGPIVPGKYACYGRWWVGELLTECRQKISKKNCSASKLDYLFSLNNMKTRCVLYMQFFGWTSGHHRVFEYQLCKRSRSAIALIVLDCYIWVNAIWELLVIWPPDCQGCHCVIGDDLLWRNELHSKGIYRACSLVEYVIDYIEVLGGRVGHGINPMLSKTKMLK